MNEDKKLLVEMGNRITKRRKELKLTQEQLAEKMNLSLQSISCIELGKKGIRPENLVNLCRVLNVSADYVLTGKKEAVQLEGITEKLANLDEEDYLVVKSLVEHLAKRR